MINSQCIIKEKKMKSTWLKHLISFFIAKSNLATTSKNGMRIWQYKIFSWPCKNSFEMFVFCYEKSTKTKTKKKHQNLVCSEFTCDWKIKILHIRSFQHLYVRVVLEISSRFSMWSLCSRSNLPHVQTNPNIHTYFTLYDSFLSEKSVFTSSGTEWPLVFSHFSIFFLVPQRNNIVAANDCVGSCCFKWEHLHI